MSAPELIETMLVLSGAQMPLRERHLQRLQHSCKALGYPWHEAELRVAIQQALVGLPASSTHRLRLLVSPTGQHRVQAAPLAPLPAGQAVLLSNERLDADEHLLGHKTSHRPWYAAATASLATDSRVFDWLFFNQRDELCEGSRSNVYVRLAGQWYTPPLRSGCLPGVMRAELLARQQVQERVIDRSLFRQAGALRLSNALRGWFDVQLMPVDTSKPVDGLSGLLP